MTSEKTKQEMREMLSRMLDENIDYSSRLQSYEFLLEDCEDIVPEMLNHLYEIEGETGKMLMEVLAGYKGRKEVYMGLVTYLYRGEDVALFARLLGSYGDENAINVLKAFVNEYEVNYNEYMEIRNAVEELGGDIDLKIDFSNDPFYRYLKGLDEVETDSRKSPFEDFFNLKSNTTSECGCDDDHCCDDDDCDGHCCDAEDDGGDSDDDRSPDEQ